MRAKGKAAHGGLPSLVWCVAFDRTNTLWEKVIGELHQGVRPHQFARKPARKPIKIGLPRDNLQLAIWA